MNELVAGAVLVVAVLGLADAAIDSWARNLRHAQSPFLAVLSKVILTFALLITLVAVIGFALLPAAIVRSERLYTDCKLQISPAQILLDHSYVRELLRTNNCKWNY